MGQIREGLLSKLHHNEREFLDRIRESVKGKNIAESLRKFARDNKDLITENDLALGFYSAKVNIQFTDIQELV